MQTLQTLDAFINRTLTITQKSFNGTKLPADVDSILNLTSKMFNIREAARVLIYSNISIFIFKRIRIENYLICHSTVFLISTGYKIVIKTYFIKDTKPIKLKTFAK